MASSLIPEHMGPQSKRGCYRSSYEVALIFPRVMKATLFTFSLVNKAA